MRIPFVKAEGAGNDFLLTWEAEAPVEGRAEAARALCHRHLGVGADGWYLVRMKPQPLAGEGHLTVDAAIHLYNSDGSEAELSGNGTRCVAAWLASLHPGQAEFVLRTGAGLRRLFLLEAAGNRFRLGMEMGRPTVFAEETLMLPDGGTVTGNRVDPGNPQFAVPVDSLDFDWKQLGAALEGHPAFPQRSNVSFYRAVDANTVEARFFERGAGATLSSGTGSTGALSAARARGLVSLPAAVRTQAGPLHFRDSQGGLVLEGAACLLAEGVFRWDSSGVEA
ncbi:MAG: diaminopimelate epimerase [Bryobacterales bacterium]|jgi:diaminopimelate epimerase|nr:diaminopimelate epimerase [Bryobacterales bacterium]